MSTKFFTNVEGNTLLEKFEGIFTYNPNIKFFDALVGYFRASGYFRIRPFLERVPKIRILVGINVDHIIADAQKAGLEFFKNMERTKEEFIKEVLDDIESARYDEATERGILQFIEDLIEKKIEVKAHPDHRLHAKIYIFRPEVFNEHTQAAVISGSSNLTDAGLGAGITHNYEFNVLIYDHDDVKFAHSEFERLWAESENILPVDAQNIRKKSYLRDDFTPFEIYIKMLIEYFGNRVDYDPYNIELLLPDKYIRLKYQTDAANQGYAIMQKHNGFILADVVGLGKTIVACMIIKKFIYENGTHTRILVVCPPAIKANWVRTSEDFQIKQHFEFITTGSLHKVLDEENYDHSNPEHFDLIIVDESHKFRNDYTDMYLELQEICKKPRKRPGENGDYRKKVILISATPLNNRPQDIENQLYLFQDRRNSTLENVKNLQDYFKPINDKYKKLAAETNLNIPKLKELFTRLRNDLVEQLVIRRTRKDILNSPDYLEDLQKQGIKFPTVDDPIPLYYKLDADLTKLFADTVEIITGQDVDGNHVDGLGYYRYRAIEFLKNDADKKIYGNVRLISERLEGIMRVLLVKRLESSFHAFKESLMRLQKACQNMINMFSEDRIFIAPDLDINKLLEEGYSYDEIEEKINQKGGNNKEFVGDSFTKDFVDLLIHDKEMIDALVKRWKKIKYDPKLEKFLDSMKKEFLKKSNNQSGKLVIFTESKETAQELEEKLTDAGFKKILLISSENRKEAESIIRSNFDANLEEEKWLSDFNIIVTTEVLAEGVNLHRSNIIVNYDVPWNSTRLMQRIGRVNRIGTRADKIFVYNFYPSAEGDFEINLVRTALRKLQAFHTAFGEDNRIFSILEEVGEGALYGSKIQQEESEILKYLIFLRDYKKKNGKEYNEIARLPHKARAGRKADVVPPSELPIVDEAELTWNIHNSSLCYLKADNHPGVFCIVSDAMNVQELSFMQAAKIFKADENEVSIDLHANHFKQTESAFEFFKSEVIQQNITSINRQNLSNVENKAITNLRMAIKLAPTPQKKVVMQQTLETVKAGSFASRGLPKEINDFFVAQSRNLTNNSEKFFTHLFTDVLDRYDFAPKTNGDSKKTSLAPRILNPKIVLTLSFS